MSRKPAHPGFNSLIGKLKKEHQERFLTRGTVVRLETGKILYDAEQPIQEVWFPITSVLSLLSVTKERAGVEVAVVGHEGMAPLAAFHHASTSAEQIVVQIPGDALCLSRESFHAALADVPAARHELHCYSQALFTLTAQSSACNRQHSVVQRCARWLLLAHDRATDDEIPLTQLFMSRLLGVRRSSVTVAAEVLRAAGGVNYTRGRLRVVDRERLEQRSCECYAIIRSTYDRLLEGKGTPSPVSLRAVPGAGASAEDGVDTEAVSPSESLEDFTKRLRAARERTRELRDAGNTQDGMQLRLLEELSIAFEELEVAEEELRAQMDALQEMHLAVAATHEQWRARFDGLPDAYFETDQYDSIIEVNRAAEDLIGAERKALIGKPFASLVQNTDRRSLRDVLTKVKEEQGAAHWSGTLVGTRVGSPMDVTAAVRATRAGSELALTPGPATRGRYIGARWLVRRKNSTH